MGEYPDEPEGGEWPTLENSDGRQIPPELVTYTPPRPEENQQKPGNQPPAQIGQPAQQPPAQQPQNSRGKSLEPLFALNGNGIVPGRPKAGGVDKEGNIYVFAERESKVHKYDPQGKQITSWAVKGPGGVLTEGSGLVVKDNNVYVLDAQSSDLLGFTLDGQPADKLHLCTCFFPRDLSLSKDGNFWVANTGNGQVLKLTGRDPTDSSGPEGREPGEFNEPSGVSQAPDGTLFVMDASNKRAQSFDADLKPLAQWEVGPSIARDGNRLAADGKGNVLVTQTEARAVVMYDKNGKELNRWVYRKNGAESSRRD